MLRKVQAVCVCLIVVASLVTASGAAPSRGNLSAPEIVDKNIAARGGLQAWRAVQTLSFEGKLGAGGNRRAALAVPAMHGKSVEQLPQRPAEEVQLPFLMDLKRGGKMRFELQLKGQTAVQVYDGTHGWKLRPFLNRLEVEPYTADELKKASMQSDLDGLLVDYAAKGSRVELEGVEKVEDRDSYKLKVTLKNGQSLHVWVDTTTFLEAKVEGQPRRLDGTDHPVEVYYRDYRTVNGLQIPFVLETRVLPMSTNALGLRDTPVPPERIAIDKVTVNPKLDDAQFSKPAIQIAAKGK
jgi:hypothetical protein